MKKVWAGLAVVALIGSAAACGDDSDESAGPDAYCELAAELDEQEAFPTAEQFEELQATAPEEIKDEVDAVVPVIVDAIEDGDPFAAFEDPVVEENIEAIEAFETDTCGLGDDEDEEASGEVNPDFADYCAVAQEIDEQDSFPTDEQFERILAAAPEEIAAEIAVVVGKFQAAGDDPGAVFEDPEVGAAFEVIEPFDEENCGIETSDEEEQDPSVTEPDPSAAQVSVAATEYAFAFDPETVAPGRTSFTMTNAGDERHVMLLFKIAEDATFDEVIESEGEEGVDGPELSSDTAATGETAVLTTDLTEGDYGMICYIPAPDGESHAAKGMVTEFTVA